MVQTPGFLGTGPAGVVQEAGFLGSDSPKPVQTPGFLGTGLIDVVQTPGFLGGMTLNPDTNVTTNRHLEVKALQALNREGSPRVFRREVSRSALLEGTPGATRQLLVRP